MLEILMKVIDRLIQLVKERQESDKKLYEDFVVPAFSDLEKLHQNYLETFQSYRRDIEARSSPLTREHPVLNKIKQDSLYFAQLRSKLSSLHDFRTDPVFGSLIEQIVYYTQGGELGKEILLSGRRRIPNAPRDYAITGLTDLFSGSESETQKREKGLAVLDRVVEELQWSYSQVVEENARLRGRLLGR